MNSKIIFMPHANIQYSQLSPQRRHWVMKNCYEKLFDLVASDDYKIAFEASGITIEEMAKQSEPEVSKENLEYEALPTKNEDEEAGQDAETDE